MEKIKIQSIEPKFGKPNDKGVCTPFWAVTFADGRKGTVWDDQIANYMEKDVGIGGECGVELKTTPTGYINIRAIDWTSAVKGNEPAPTVPIPSIADDRSKSIIAQCLVKAVLGQVDSKVEIEDAVKMYKKALELL